MGRVLAMLVALPVALAADEPLAEFQRARKARQRAQAEFRRAYQARLNDAQEVSTRPIREAHSRKSEDREAVLDLEPYRYLYEDYAAIESAYGRAAEVLARSGDPDAAKVLLRDLFDTVAEARRAEEELRELCASSRVDVFDQQPGIARHGLACRERALIEALALHPVFLAAEAWPEAVRADGRTSHARRVAVLDALGAGARPEARPMLVGATASAEIPIRIAAIEALALHGRDATPALLPMLADPSEVVRRALVDSVRAGLAADQRWIGPLIEAYPATAGALRRGMVEALSVLSGQGLGDDPTAWAEWYERSRTAIEAGKLPAKPPIVQPPSRAPTFYGVPLRGGGTIFLLDWSSPMLHPADWEFERTRYADEWLYGSHSWKGEHMTHREFLEAELGRALGALEPSSRFAIVLGTDGFRRGIEEAEEYVLGWDRLLAPTRPSIERANRFVRERKPYHWRSQLSMLMTAFAIADRDPAADSAILLSDGAIHGGHFIDPEAALAAFARWNRFRRLVVDTVRIRDAKGDAKTLMEGFARLSGGRYVWLRNPPAGK